jgi:hypothetical protein
MTETRSVCLTGITTFVVVDRSACVNFNMRKRNWVICIKIVTTVLELDSGVEWSEVKWSGVE